MRALVHPVIRRLAPALAGLALAACRPAGSLVRSGQIYVTSAPPDATLLCDGVNWGQTPVTVLDVAIRGRWAPGRTALVALAGTIPFLSFVLERRTTHLLRAEAQGRTRSRATAAPTVPAPHPDNA